MPSHNLGMGWKSSTPGRASLPENQSDDERKGDAAKLAREVARQAKAREDRSEGRSPRTGEGV